MRIGKREFGIALGVSVILIFVVEFLLHWCLVRCVWCWIWANVKPECWLAVLTGVGIMLTGGLGGILGACYRRKCCTEPCFQRWSDIFAFGGAGAASAFSVIVVCKGLGLIIESQDLFAQTFKLYGLTFVSGFFAMRLIPKIGLQIEQRLDRIDAKVERVAKEGQNLVAYQKLLSVCQVALAKDAPMSDVDDALGLLRKGLQPYWRDRTLNIYYGRLLRQKGDLRGAIVVLREYVDRMLRGIDRGKLPPEESTAVSVAYYNIACYHSLLMKGAPSEPHEQERLRKETKDALTASYAFDAGIAGEWKTDEDFDPFREVEKDFSLGT